MTARTMKMRKALARARDLAGRVIDDETRRTENLTQAIERIGGRIADSRDRSDEARRVAERLVDLPQ